MTNQVNGPAAILTSSKAVREAIRSVFSSPRARRIALVGFVGADAEAFLPKPRGLELYCWPRAGGTNPYALQRLRRAGVNVRFVEHLHAKMYWSQRDGVVIGSANLTNNALGEGGLFEIAVRLPSNVVDVDHILRRLVVVKDFDGRLRELLRDHVRFCQRNTWEGQVRRVRTTKPSLDQFTDWWEQGRARPDWRFGWYAENEAAPRDALSEYHERFGSNRYAEFIGASRKSDYPVGTFVLSALVARRRGSAITLGAPRWWVPEFNVKSADREWRDYPYISFCRNRLPDGVLPPFDCKDPAFLRALSDVLAADGGLTALESTPTSLPTAQLRRVAATMRRRRPGS